MDFIFKESPENIKACRIYLLHWRSASRVGHDPLQPKTLNYLLICGDLTKRYGCEW